MFTGLPPAQPPLSGSETFPADSLLGPRLVSLPQMGAWMAANLTDANMLIAGDAEQNLWQRGTTGPTVSTTVEYGPDRWAYWSGTSTQVVVSRDVSSLGAVRFKVQRVAGQTGTSQICFAQEILSANAAVIAGQYVEFDYGMQMGNDFSGPSVTSYLISGTRTDEGVGKMAFGLNGGGGSSAGWTSQAEEASAAYTSTVQGGVYHPVTVALLPASKTEFGVAVCWVPTGTAGTDDAIYLGQLQLRAAPNLQSYQRPLFSWDARIIEVPTFAWRLYEVERQLQLMYLEVLNEGAGPVPVADCRSVTSNQSDCLIGYPLRMLRVPTVTYHAGFATDTNSGGLQACTSLATVNSAGPRSVLVRCSAGGPTPQASILWENGGSGQIMVDGELY